MLWGKLYFAQNRDNARLLVCAHGGRFYRPVSEGRSLSEPSALIGTRSAQQAKIYGHPNRTESQNSLSLHQPCLAVSARGAPAPGAALPHSRGQLLAEGRAGGAFHQLAAGSLQQPAGAAGFPQENYGVFRG